MKENTENQGSESIGRFEQSDAAPRLPLKPISRNYWDIVMGDRTQVTSSDVPDCEMDEGGGMRANADAEERFVLCQLDADANPELASREDTMEYFICGLNGCEEILPREFFQVRSHIRYSLLHVAGTEDSLPQTPCPFEDCGYMDQSKMRVAEHVCSDRHFNAKVACYGLKCKNKYNGRTSSLKRHRDGDSNAKFGSCKCCEGCPSVFASGLERARHEIRCEAALKTKADRLWMLKQEEREQRRQSRMRAKNRVKEEQHEVDLY